MLVRRVVTVMLRWGEREWIGGSAPAALCHKRDCRRDGDDGVVSGLTPSLGKALPPLCQLFSAQPTLSLFSPGLHD